MTYFTLSSPFVHYLLPDSSVCFILKTGGAENSVHACRRRYAPSRTDQNARKNGIFVHCPYINKGVVHFSRLVVLLWCLSTGETKTPWKKRSAVPDDFQLNIWIIAVYIISIGYAVHGFCGYFKENPPHDRFYFTHKHTTYFCINTPPKPNDRYLKRRCMKKKKQAESERGDFH